MSDTKNGRFIKARDKYADMRSSASSLLIVGILGAVYMIIDHLKILPFTINPNGNWMLTITMSALFIVFIISGIYTYISCAKVKDSINAEEALTADIKEWMTSKLTAQMVDNKCEELRKVAYDSAISECLDETKEDDITIIDEDVDSLYETTEIDGEEYDVVAFESFYDIPNEMKALEREEAIIKLASDVFKDVSPAHISYVLEDVYDKIFNA